MIHSIDYSIHQSTWNYTKIFFTFSLCLQEARMRLFSQGYVLYPWLIKLVFISSLIFQSFANYVVVQRWILPRDIIEEMPFRTVTLCVMKCTETTKCAAVGFKKDPDYSKNDKCLLLKMLRKKKKNGTRIKIFALVEVY